MTTMTYESTLTVLDCCTCQIDFAIPNLLYQQARKDSSIWVWCPKGHQQHWPGAESDEAKLERKLEAERDRVARLTAQVDQAEAEAEHQSRRANGYKGALTKVKKRLGAGLCPCCSHEFKDVAAHMRRMHPEHVEADQ